MHDLGLMVRVYYGWMACSTVRKRLKCRFFFYENLGWSFTVYIRSD